MKIIKVKSCNACPLMLCEEEEYEIFLLKYTCPFMHESIEEQGILKNCPLRNENIMITLDEPGPIA